MTNSFDDELERRLGTRIKKAEQLVVAAKTRALKPFALTVPQYAALLYLRHASAASAAQMARACLVTPQTMATILGNLETKGLVERSTSLFHQKVLETRLTAQGEDIVDAADKAARQVEERMLGALSAEEVELVKKLLDRLIEVFDDEG